MKNIYKYKSFKFLSILTLFLLTILITPSRSYAAVESKFNFTNEAYSVPGWTNVSGDPKTAVRTKTDSLTGIGVRSITANWNNANGGNAWNGAGQTIDNGSGFVVPAGVLLNYWYNTNSVFSAGKYHAQVFGLNSSKTYNLTFTASRSDQNGAVAPRIADYNIRGISVLAVKSLDVWQNTSRTVVFTNVKPNSSGVIDIGINKKANNTGGAFGYLGGLIVTEYTTTATNTPPTANAGIDQTIQLPINSVSLTGSGTDSDGTISSYSWTKLSGGTATIASPNSSSTTITGLVAGSYTFRLTVTDNLGATFSDDVAITVNTAANIPPSVNAGSDQSYTMPTNSFILYGSATDTDGNVASYQWIETSTNYTSILSINNAVTTVRDLAAGTHTFRLTVTDNQGASSFDDVAVVVSPHAVSSCSPKTIVVLGSSTSAGYGINPISDSYVNRFTSYIQSLNSNNNVINLAVGGYTSYQLLPTDSTVPANRPTPDTNANITKALSYSPAAIIINLPSNDVGNGFTNSEQQANIQIIIAAATAANVPVWITTTQPRNFDLAGITNQIAMRDWIQATYTTQAVDFWTIFANPDGTINNIYDQGDGIHLNNIAHKKLYARIAESSLISTICTQATNTPPTANAGIDQTIQLPINSVSLTGSGTDSDGTISAYSWTKVSGGTATITSPNSSSTTITGLVAGSYTFRLTVTDNLGATFSDDVAITVNTAANIPPSVSTTINSVSLGGVAIDTDGTIVAYTWSQVSGPNTANISTLNTATTTVSNLVTGNYVFRLTVIDNNGASTSSNVQFTIN